MKIPCKIKQKPRDTKSKWLIIETEDMAILQIMYDSCFNIPKSIKEGELIIEDNIFDLRTVNKDGYGVTYHTIGRKTMNHKQYNKFCREYGTKRLVKKFENFLKKQRMLNIKYFNENYLDDDKL